MLEKLNITNHTNTAQQKWLTKLLGYDYEILYTPGRGIVVADALHYNRFGF